MTHAHPSDSRFSHSHHRTTNNKHDSHDRAGRGPPSQRRAMAFFCQRFFFASASPPLDCAGLLLFLGELPPCLALAASPLHTHPGRNDASCAGSPFFRPRACSSCYCCSARRRVCAGARQLLFSLCFPYRITVDDWRPAPPRYVCRENVRYSNAAPWATNASYPLISVFSCVCL